MSPKRAASKALRKKKSLSIESPEKSEPQATQQDGSMRFAAEEDEKALLPWLALGFYVVPTPANYCGIAALVYAYNSARQALYELGNNETAAPEPLAIGTVKQWYNSKEYEDKALEWLAEKRKEGFTTEEMEELVMITKKDLEFEQINILLLIANDKNGTDFQLGRITEGVKGKWEEVKGKKRWNKEFIQQPLAGSFDVMEKKPMIWIRNNNIREIVRAEREGNVEEDDLPIPHWDGLGKRIKDSQAKQKAGNLDCMKRWGLTEKVQKDIKKGVWMVIREGEGTESLDASPGTFLREAGPRDPKQKEFRLMKAPVGDSGNVSEDNIRKLGIPEEPISEDEESSSEDDELSAEFGGKGEGERRFIIYRAIHDTNSVGEYVEREDQDRFVRGFRFEVGDFLFSHRESNERGLVNVTDYWGREGKARKRSLQLLDNPWGLGSLLVSKPKIFALSSRELIKEAKSRFGKDFDTNLEDIKLVSLIMNHEREISASLPMAWIHRKSVKEEGNPRFRDGEVIYVDGGPKVGTNMRKVRDFEGKEGEIDSDELRLMKNPWGVRVPLKKGKSNAQGASKNGEDSSNKRNRQQNEEEDDFLFSPSKKTRK